MRTVRPNVFETNSSSEHCITFSKEYRTADEFPKLNKDGILEVEIKHYWTCGALGTTTNKVTDIIEYLCALAVNCASKYPASMDQLMEDLTIAYKNVNLDHPKGVEVYVVDDYDRKVPYYKLANQEVDYVVINSDGYYECNFPNLNNFFAEMSREDFAEFERLHKGFMYEKVVKISRQIGLSYNLIFGDYKSSIDDIYPSDISDDNRYDAQDLLLHKSKLSFFHT